VVAFFESFEGGKLRWDTVGFNTAETELDSVASDISLELFEFLFVERILLIPVG